MRIGISTPWGVSQSGVETDVKGIEFHSTASHGGYWVSPELSPKLAEDYGSATGAGLPDPIRSGTWWEEDCAWAFVALAFPAAFPPHAQTEARSMVRWIKEIHREGWLHE